jgi:hypothetical protein
LSRFIRSFTGGGGAVPSVVQAIGAGCFGFGAGVATALVGGSGIRGGRSGFAATRP